MDGTSNYLGKKADRYSHSVYDLCLRLPKYENYGLASQMRRASLSVTLNIIEGFTRQSHKSELNFLQISFGSLKESQYLIKFAADRQYIDESTAKAVFEIGDELGKLLWTKIQNYKKLINFAGK